MGNKKVMGELKKLVISLLAVFMMVSIMPTNLIKAEGETETVYTLHYHKNDGTDEMIDKTYTDNSSVLETELFQIENKLMTEWNTQEDGNGTAYSLESTIKDVFKKETEIHLYAMWNDVQYTVQFKDFVDGKENIFQEMKSDQLKVKLPQPNTEQHKEEIFKGWKSSIDEKLYQADTEVDVITDMSFTAVWEANPVVLEEVQPIVQEEVQTKADEIKKVVYYRENSREDEQTLEVTDNPTIAADYPDQFNEDGQVKREFLYWSTSTNAYIDDSLPKIYPGDDLNDFDVNVYDGKVELNAVYDNNDKLFINYYVGDKAEMSSTSYFYETDAVYGQGVNKFFLKDVDILDGNKFDREYLKFKNWNFGDPYFEMSPIYEVGFVDQLELDTSYINEYNICNFLINGYIDLVASFRDEAVKIKYEIGYGVGNAPVDNNIYGVEEGLTHVFTVKDGKDLALGDRGKVVSWTIELDDRSGSTYKIGDRYVADDFLSRIAGFVDEDRVVHFYPNYVDTYCIQFDVSDTQISIEKPDDIVTFSDEIDLPNLDDQFKDTDEYFVGWKDENGEIFNGTVTLNSEDYIHKFSIVTAKNSTFKVKYDCSWNAGMTCPVDENEYTIGDTIYVGNAAEEDIEKSNVYFAGWYIDDTSTDLFLNEDIPASTYQKNIKDGILTIKPYYDIKERNHILLYQNTTDEVRSFSNYQDYTGIFFTRLPMPIREGYYFEGWSTKTDKNEAGAKFYSYWKESLSSISGPLYAQWIPMEDVKKGNDYAYITLQRDLGHGESIEKSIYVKKGTKLNMFFDAGNFPSANGDDEMADMLNEYHGFTIKDDNGNLYPTVSDNFATYKMTSEACKEINFIGTKEGKLIDNDGNTKDRIKTNYEDGFYYHYIENIPTVKPNRGYSFVGWDIFPYIKETIPMRFRLEGIQRGNNAITTKELNNFLVRYENLHFNQEEYAGIFTALDIYPVFEPISKATGEVQYYYDGVKEEEATESIDTEYYVGEKLEDYEYKDKIKDNYEFDKVEGLPLTFDEDASKNVIKVYYKKKTTSLHIEYYYDGIEDKKATYDVSDLKVGDHYEEYKDKKKEHYSLASVTIPEKLVEDPTKNVIKVYYVRNKTTAKVEYYYDDKLDEDATEILSDQNAGEQLKEYPEKLKDGFELDRTENLPLTLNEDSTKNVIKIYYVKKKEPTKPTTPEQPSKPETPETPETPEKPSNPQSQDPKPSTDTKKRPVAGINTGDRTNMNIWIGVCLLSIATIAGIMVVSKKKKAKE